MDHEQDQGSNTIGVPPAVPGFGFQFSSFGSGTQMPMLPPGFPAFAPGTGQQPPPPPGQH